ncbi:MAG: hypothetical protein LBU85_11530 [Treponema sp.]|jgi:hypothetical protein|nr:hypothetical protein [Treponema sp.]
MSLFRFFARKIFALVVLFLAVSFIGCKPEPDPENTGFIPVGEWTDDWGGSYKITASFLEFDDGFGSNFTGSIIEAVDFSKDAGVLLVQITTSSTEGQADKFIGVYYKDYTASHILLANAVDGSYTLILKGTLAEAKKIFTVDNVETHVTYWGTGYTK